MAETFLGIPNRPSKPRDRGWTHVIDKGLPVRDVESLIETAGEHIDIVKLGWGTSYVTANLGQKVRTYQDAGIPVVCGGTLLEAAIARGRVDEYRRFTAAHGFTHVEVSDGVIQIERGSKLELISMLAADFVVLSEVGSKDAECVFPPYQWVEWIKEELAAGATKVIAEAREGGNAGIFRANGEVRSGLIDEIVHSIAPELMVFEAPLHEQQGWFVRRFGPDVNLGNIPPEEVIALETLRLGLRSDTMAELILKDTQTQT
jgi:phosphosulfolactate synthase